MTQSEQMVEKAKVRIMLNSPFFASLALGMNYIENPGIETARTDGEMIEYNPDHVRSLSVSKLSTLIAHEALHGGLLHPLRLEGKDHDTFNRAADYAINLLLRDSGFELPDNSLIDNKYENMTAEQIYSVLQAAKQQDKQNNQQDDQKGNQTGQGQSSPQPGNGNQQKKQGNQQGKSPEHWGEVVKPDNLTPEKKSELEAKGKQRLAQAAEAGRMAGTMPSGMAISIKNVLDPVIDWQEVLNRFIAEIAHNDYRWTKPSPRYLPSGLYLPSLNNVEIGKIIFAIDTSGSVSRDMLGKFAAELKDVAGMFSVPITVIHCDTTVHKVEELEQDSVIDPVGGGGTDFRPPFKLVDTDYPDAKALIYFTDGDCYKFPTEPDYPVIWMIYRSKSFTPPFGEVVYIN